MNRVQEEELTLAALGRKAAKKDEKDAERDWWYTPTFNPVPKNVRRHPL